MCSVIWLHCEGVSVGGSLTVFDATLTNHAIHLSKEHRVICFRVLFQVSVFPSNGRSLTPSFSVVYLWASSKDWKIIKKSFSKVEQHEIWDLKRNGWIFIPGLFDHCKQSLAKTFILIWNPQIPKKESNSAKLQWFSSNCGFSFWITFKTLTLVLICYVQIWDSVKYVSQFLEANAFSWRRFNY